MSAPSPIQSTLEALHARLAPLADGAVATYIPELAKADPKAFGIVVATVDGQVYEVGDTRVPFTIQSISKPLVYGAALEDVGEAGVRRAIGVEPSGDAFNSISLEAGTGRPRNPMINAGAIATASLVGSGSTAQRLARIVGAISAHAGRELSIDEAVFASERDTGHRNRAIGHMLRNYDILRDDPDQALELYFRQCSVLVDCRDLALIGATLANGGRHPLTQVQALAPEHVGHVLSVMTTCGMYDFSGEWVYRVGMPAKSGVGGGIVAVLPGQLGIGVWSPPLDERGNSVRGVKVCETLSASLGLHFLEPPWRASAALRARYTLASVRSKRRRSPEENRVLEAQGGRCLVLELQGELGFASVEPVLRAVLDSADAAFAVLDFKRVVSADDAATQMLARLVSTMASRGQQLVLTRVRRDLLGNFSAELDPKVARAASFQPQLDLGLEWCERRLLERVAPPRDTTRTLPLADHQLCAGASAADIAHLESILERHSYEAGTTIVRRGDAADALYLIVRGEVSVVVGLPGGGHKRLATLSAGMGFGESALIAGGARTADVRSDTEVDCLLLPAEAFARLERERPTLLVALLRNLLRSSMQTAARLTAEVAALEA